MKNFAKYAAAPALAALAFTTVSTDATAEAGATPLSSTAVTTQAAGAANGTTTQAAGAATTDVADDIIVALEDLMRRFERLTGIEFVDVFDDDDDDRDDDRDDRDDDRDDDHDDDD